METLQVTNKFLSYECLCAAIHTRLTLARVDYTTKEFFGDIVVLLGELKPLCIKGFSKKRDCSAVRTYSKSY